jgi:ribose 5-phosphate isomerase B
MRISFGTDERTPVTDAVEAWLTGQGHEVELAADRGGPWPDVGTAVGRAVAEGRADRGVVCCWTGTGVSIAANKVPGVRAALCTDRGTAEGARRWNDANVLAFGLRLTTEALAAELLEAFLSTDLDDGEQTLIDRVEPADGSAPPA